MSVQPPLIPAVFASTDPRDELAAAKARCLQEVAAVLRRHGRQEGIYFVTVQSAIDQVDQAVSDMFHDVEERLRAEIDGEV